MKTSIMNAALNIEIMVRRIVYVVLYLIDTKLLKEKNLITILCYHSVADNDWRFTVSPNNFRKQINYLKEAGYSFITLHDVTLYVQGKKAITTPSIVLTFDDGYVGLESIADFLYEQNIYPSLFVLSDKQNANRKELGNTQSFLTIQHIKALQQKGWEIGSHTDTHSNLTKISERQLQKEIIESKNTLQKELQTDIDYISFPKGKYNYHTIELANKAGYTVGLTMDDGTISPSTNLLTLPRVGVDSTHSMEEFKGAFTPLTIKLRRYIKSTKLASFL